MSNLIRNPDILTCLANLSNDEVFTPPEIANALLDLVPSDFWKDPNVRVLDPACKSGVFLREAAKRFIEGEREVFPNLEERLDHIFHKQLFGYAITELTAHLSRRTVYCSKNPKSKYSVTKFDKDGGNIVFSRVEHTWQDKRCKLCGASQEVYDKGKDAETHAYKFIHLTPQRIKELDMKFDLIIGNPPYQLMDGGAQASAKPIYQLFVQTAKKLNPKYICMIMPSRWMTTGKGLDSFRDEMIHDKHIIKLYDYLNSKDVFPGVDIKGGVCYFLRDRDSEAMCEIHTIESDGEKVSTRYLAEDDTDIFIRNSTLLSIKKKIEKSDVFFSTIVSARKPYGLEAETMVNAQKYGLTPFSQEEIKDGYRVLGLGEKQKRMWKYLPKDYPIPKKDKALNMYKVFIAEAYGCGAIGEVPSTPVLSTPGELCTETFLQIGPFETRQEAQNAYIYILSSLDA